MSGAAWACWLACLHYLFLVQPAVASLVSHTAEREVQLRYGQFCFGNDGRGHDQNEFVAYQRHPVEYAWQQELWHTLPNEVSQTINAFEKAVHNSGAESAKSRRAEFEASYLYERPTLLSNLMHARGYASLGDTRRLERFAWKLISGKAVKVVALGGTMTAGAGLKDGRDAWVARVFEWLKAAFPNEGHKLVNVAVPGTTSCYLAPCALQVVPGDADLILLEYTFTDGQRAQSNDMDEPTRRGLERLLRKLLQIGSHPALLYLHFWTPFDRVDRTKLAPVYEGAEDLVQGLLNYYSIPSLSMRNALHTRLDAQPNLYDAIWAWDRLHPTCIGSKYLADLVIGCLQDLAAHVIQAFEALDTQPPFEELLGEWPPRPMFDGNGVGKRDVCMAEEALHGLAVKTQGWEYVAEEAPSGKGFVSGSVGDRLVLRVPVSGLLFANRVLIALGLRVAPEGMGYAQVECSTGCTCASRELSLHQLFHSAPFWRALNVTISAGSASCDVAVTNINKTVMGEHGVEVAALFVSEELDFLEARAACPDCDDALAAAERDDLLLHGEAQRQQEAAQEAERATQSVQDAAKVEDLRRKQEEKRETIIAELAKLREHREKSAEAALANLKNVPKFKRIYQGGKPASD